MVTVPVPVTVMFFNLNIAPSEAWFAATPWKIHIVIPLKIETKVTYVLEKWLVFIQAEIYEIEHPFLFYYC